MAFLRRMKPSVILKCLVAPSLFLCAIFHRQPVFQWIAVGTVAFWLVAAIASAVGKSGQKHKRELAEKRLWSLHDDPIDAPAWQDTAEGQLYLLRHINCRITEQLKGTYPAASWLWMKRPSAEELYHGGSWRIQTANTEPFNFADVDITDRSQLTITMLQAVSLNDAQTHASELVNSDLSQSEILDRVDVKQWYYEHGEQLLAQTIDELNSQGHRKLLIHENGDVCITSSGVEKAVETLRDFPPRIAWDSFCTLLKEDDIMATVQSEGLMLSW